MKNTYTLLAATLMAVGLLTACGGGDPVVETPVATTQAVELSFAATAGSDPITCASSLTGMGTSDASGGLKDMRFYIANVKLVRADGSEAPLTLPPNDDWNATLGSDGVTLIDLEDNTGTCVGTAATNTTLRGTVPAGNYVGVKMTLGVPFALNHTDQGASTSVTPAAINNAVNPGMAWAWAGGRKFAKIEVTDPGWAAPTFNVHIGSTGCTGVNPAAGQVDTCSKPNRLDLAFGAFDPTTQKIAVDVKALLTGNDVTVNGSGPTGCMSGTTDPECPKVFEALAIDLAGTGQTVGDGSTQTVFKVVAK
ncbi:MbnP family copper-binding protein [Hydrogenophaga sp.]|uniref:MbnP family copper-binding protein n=1 Tax=Hydrogenophaga sp. TaxID=1904254 RepID=UPI00261C904B|nr:MbnP family copper-binding protein [Hydrogenophaga sp.]MDM7948641.1 metallo-mystery pair system four-Cys motif protein [Hydrogenophaga sp.]